MFQFSGFATIQQTFSLLGFPIRTRADLTVVCTSPHIFAAYHVLRRLQEPRHPPCALIHFLFSPCRNFRRSKTRSLYTSSIHGQPNHLITHTPSLPFYLHFLSSPSLVNERFDPFTPVSSAIQAILIRTILPEEFNSNLFRSRT
jgi:hypothetical protein